MPTLDLIMTGFTGSTEIRKMAEKAIKSIRDSEGSENFKIIYLESNLESKHKYDVDVQIHPDFPYHCNKYYNIGITHSDADFTAIVNNDTYFHPTWWTKMYEAIEKHGLDSASPRSAVEQFGIVPQVELKHRYTPISKVVIGHYPVYTFCGWCWVIKRHLRDVVFPVDERWSFYFNDNDVCNQLQELGYKHGLVAASMVDHFGQKSHKALHDRGEYHKHTYGLEPEFMEKWKHLMKK